MRYFPLMLYASAENRDWGVGRIESRSYHIISNETPEAFPGLDYLKCQWRASIREMPGI
jgi:hypothetical protein